MHFAYPWVLILLPVLGLVALLRKRRHQRTGLRIPSARGVALPLAKAPVWRHCGDLCRALAVILAVIALARPLAGSTRGKKVAEGLDIVLVIDTSGSMKERDFVLLGRRPSRLDVVKKVIADFITERTSDRVGLVVFGTEAFTQAPLTLDHDVLLRFLEKVQIGMAGEATAIGDGIATAVNRLKDIDAKARVVILLTDGANTAGRVDPLAAAEAAKAKGARVYTIGVGTTREADEARRDKAKGGIGDVDTHLLRTIAEMTGGATFYATDTDALINVYETIDKLEKTRITVDSFAEYDERYGGFAAAALGFLVLDVLFGLTRFRRIP